MDAFSKKFQTVLVNNPFKLSDISSEWYHVKRMETFCMDLIPDALLNDLLDSDLVPKL